MYNEKEIKVLLADVISLLNIAVFTGKDRAEHTEELDPARISDEYLLKTLQLVDSFYRKTWTN
jgi:hypothetical protein